MASEATPMSFSDYTLELERANFLAAQILNDEEGTGRPIPGGVDKARDTLRGMLGGLQTMPEIPAIYGEHQGFLSHREAVLEFVEGALTTAA